MNESERPSTGTAHGPDGDFIATIEQAERDAEAARMRSRRMTYRQIAAAMGVGVGTAHRMVERAIAEVRRDAGETVVVMEMERLDSVARDYDHIEAIALDVLRANHIVIQQGQVVLLDGQPVTDHGPVLAAVETLRRLGESRRALSESVRKLLGADAAQKMETTSQVRFVVEGVDLGDL